MHAVFRTVAINVIQQSEARNAIKLSAAPRLLEATAVRSHLAMETRTHVCSCVLNVFDATAGRSHLAMETRPHL